MRCELSTYRKYLKSYFNCNHSFKVNRLSWRYHIWYIWIYKFRICANKTTKARHRGGILIRLLSLFTWLLSMWMSRSSTLSFLWMSTVFTLPATLNQTTTQRKLISTAYIHNLIYLDTMLSLVLLTSHKSTRKAHASLSHHCEPDPTRHSVSSTESRPWIWSWWLIFTAGQKIKCRLNVVIFIDAYTTCHLQKEVARIAPCLWHYLLYSVLGRLF